MVSVGACEPRNYQDGFLAASGVFDAETEECSPAHPEPESITWLMVHDAEAVAFEFDDEVSVEGPEEAFWSGTMTMAGEGADQLQDQTM